MDRIINGETRICGLVGDPLGYTVSPLMHNAAFEKLGLNYLYVPFTVKREDLQNAIKGLKALNIRGFNIGMPHKMGVIPLLDKMDEMAAKIGAVNTVVNDDGILTGYNTDAIGCLNALLEKGIEPKGKNAVIIGAGGASKSISFILADRGANLTIINRTLSKAIEIAANITKYYQVKIETLQLNEENLASALKNADILLNTTKVGVVPNVDETAVPSSLLRPDLAVFDAVYNPIKTRLLREAEETGAIIIEGANMLLAQGAVGFEKWTGIEAPVDLMREVVVKGLTG